MSKWASVCNRGMMIFKSQCDCERERNNKNSILSSYLLYHFVLNILDLLKYVVFCKSKSFCSFKMIESNLILFKFLVQCWQHAMHRQGHWAVPGTIRLRLIGPWKRGFARHDPLNMNPQPGMTLARPVGLRLFFIFFKKYAGPGLARLGLLHNMPGMICSSLLQAMPGQFGSVIDHAWHGPFEIITGRARHTPFGL